ncbi:MAG: Holliday junction resolvase RuvX [Pseudomonadota bacterium]
MAKPGDLHGSFLIAAATGLNMPRKPDTTIDQFVTQLQGGGRLLALDLGTKTIGMALCDGDWFVSSPVTTIKRTKFTADAEELMAWVKKEEIAGLIMGLPLNMDGSEGPRAQATRAFMRNLQRFSPPIHIFHDERLTSNEAKQAMEEAGIAPAKWAHNIDRYAANLILQSALVPLGEARTRLLT